MAEYKITKKRLAQIIKEEYQRIQTEEAKKPDFLDLDKDVTKKSRWKMLPRTKKRKRVVRKKRRKILARYRPSFVNQ